MLGDILNRAPIIRHPASDERLRGMKICLERTKDYDQFAYYDLRDLVRDRLSDDERARFDAIPVGGETEGGGL